MLDLGDLLGKLTDEDIEKLKLLASIFNGGAQQNLKDISLQQGFSEYEKYANFNLAAKTVQLIKTANKRFLEFYPGNRSLLSFQRKDAENLLMNISKTAPLGVYNYLRVYKSEFNVFKDWEYVSKSPFENVKLASRQKEEPIVFVDDQVELCCYELRKNEKNTIADMVEFSKLTALRAGEITNLRWGDVDMNNESIAIGNKIFKTKSRKKRILPINEQAIALITANKKRQNETGNKKSEFVFAQRNGKKYQVNTISKTLKRTIRALGLPEELHWHSLRATAATRWVSKRVPIYTVSKLLGHSDVKVTSRYYATVDAAELRKAVNET